MYIIYTEVVCIIYYYEYMSIKTGLPALGKMHC